VKKRGRPIADTKTGVIPAGKFFRVKIRGVVHRNAYGEFATFKKSDQAKDWLIEHLSNQLWLTSNSLENIRVKHAKFEEAKQVLFGDMIERIDSIDNQINRLACR